MRPARLVAPLAVLAAACGLLAPPGDYTSGGDAPDASASEGGDALAPPPPPPPGNVPPPPGSAGTLFVVAGERDPTSAADDPAWTTDVWEGVLDAQGHVVAWNVRQSAAIPGPYDSASVAGGQLFTLSFGIGVNGTNRGDVLSEVAWGPGGGGAWKAVGVGMPGGLDERARTMFGAHVVTVGGVRYFTDDAGTQTVFTKEVHIADIDTTMGTLGGFHDGPPLQQARSRAGAAVIDGVLYVVGGRVPSGAFSGALETAKVDAAMGTVSAFTSQPQLTNGGVEHKVWAPAVAGGGGFLFVAGGHTTYNNGGQPTDVVVVAQTTADGTVSNVKNGPPLPTPLRDLGLAVKAGRLYAIGGENGMNRVDTVYSASIAADGTLGAWATDTKLPSPRSDFVVVPYGGTP